MNMHATYSSPCTGVVQEGTAQTARTHDCTLQRVVTPVHAKLIRYGPYHQREQLDSRVAPSSACKLQDPHRACNRAILAHRGAPSALAQATTACGVEFAPSPHILASGCSSQAHCHVRLNHCYMKSCNRDWSSVLLVVTLCTKIYNCGGLRTGFGIKLHSATAHCNENSLY